MTPRIGFVRTCRGPAEFGIVPDKLWAVEVEFKSRSRAGRDNRFMRPVYGMMVLSAGLERMTGLFLGPMAVVVRPVAGLVAVTAGSVLWRWPS